MFVRPFAKGMRRIPWVIRGRPEVIDVGWKNPYYAVTKLDADLVNDRLHPNTGAPNYNVKHEFSDLVSKSHTLLDDIGTKTHPQIDTHIADGTIHYAQGSIDHTAILNIGTKTHPQIDTHIADGTIHFAKPLSHTDVGDISNVGTNTHAQIDTHIAADQANSHDGDQLLKSTDSPTFNALTVTSIAIGADILDTNEFAYLDGLDQALKTTDDVVFGTVDCTELFNSGGPIRLMPDAQGDLLCFNRTDVGNNSGGKSLYIYRKASEGDSYFRIFVDKYRGGNLQFHSAVSTDTMKYFNYAGDTLFHSAHGKIRLNYAASGDVTCFDAVDVSDDVDGKSFYVHRKAYEGDTYLRIYGKADTSMRILSATSLLLACVSTGISLDLGDNAGAQHVAVRDSDLATVWDIDSDGIMNFQGVMGDSSKNPTTDAPADWVQVEIGGTTYYLPAYIA